MICHTALIGTDLLIMALREIATIGFAFVRLPKWNEGDRLAYLARQQLETMIGALVQGGLAVILLVRRRAGGLSSQRQS